MKNFRTVSCAALLGGLLLIGNHPSRGQDPKSWKSFHQTFIIPRYPQFSYGYAHTVVMKDGKFMATTRRDYAPEEYATDDLVMDLSEIDTSKLKIVKGKEGYLPDYYYLYIPVKNPDKAPERALATPGKERRHLIVKDEVRFYHGDRVHEIWLLNRMYINFDNETAAYQAIADITAACQ